MDDGSEGVFAHTFRLSAGYIKIPLRCAGTSVARPDSDPVSAGRGLPGVTRPDCSWGPRP
ncbi:hypothetical protein BN903_303 [Halorubrum sp. AJ67]|nr:hypothetical protein BN903_303 [Halorubrum sp. AJ67]